MIPQIAKMVDGVNAANDRTYIYDGLGRLSNATGIWGTGSYVYDAVGNLRSKTFLDSGVTRTVTNTYDASNKITSSIDSVNGTRPVNFLNNRGLVTQLGGLNFTWFKSNQISGISGDVTASYRYDGNKHGDSYRIN